MIYELIFYLVYLTVMLFYLFFIFDYKVTEFAQIRI